MSALANVARGNFNSKFTAKKWFSDRAFFITIADPDIGSIKSVHTLFVKHLDHILVNFEQNRTIVKSNYRKFWAFWQKMVDHFWQRIDAILDDGFVTGKKTVWCHTINLKSIIFQCSKVYGNLKRVTRLKFAPNIAILVSPNEKGL